MTVVGRMTAAAVVVAGSIVLGGTAHAAVASQSAESGQITSPSDGQVVTSGSVTVSAHTGMMQLNMGLYVDGPSTPKQKIASGGANQTLSGTFDAGSAPNGTFNVTLKGEITGSTYSTSTFKLRRPAAVPTGVNAELQGKSKIVVTWTKGSEPDLQSYELSTTQSGIVGRLASDTACSGSTCKASLAVPTNAAGHKVGFTVKAYRGDGDGGSLASGSSGVAYVAIPAPKAAKPKKSATPTARPTTKNTTQDLPTLPNGHAKPTTAPTQQAVPKDLQKLPAMPSTDPKGNFPLPTATGDTDGALAPDSSKDAATTDSQVQAQSTESPMGNIGQYGLYVAGGLILLLLAANVGAWARRRSLAAAASGGGSAARVISPAMPPTGDGARFAETSPPATTAPRRPTVVLAVAKTRPADRTDANRANANGADAGRTDGARTDASRVEAGRMDAGRAADDRTAGAGVAAADRAASSRGRAIGAGTDSTDRVVLDHAALSRAADAGAESFDRTAGADTDPFGRAAAADGDGRTAGTAARADAVDGDGRTAGTAARADAVDGSGADRVTGGRDARPRMAELLASDLRAEDFKDEPAGRSQVPGQGRIEALYLSAEDVIEGRPEPVRIALPSSAVTVMPDGSGKPPAVRIEDRWDDYLPSAPRAMEDSGFWERPAPGDFWAADEEPTPHPRRAEES